MICRLCFDDIADGEDTTMMYSPSESFIVHLDCYTEKIKSGFIVSEIIPVAMVK